ncbi:MAG: methylmalonyl-CoA mutase, partial [Rhodothermaceae bacterium]|nr:methylmalonyl-CoA mutase [Rhodothermaceae bacterium]
DDAETLLAAGDVDRVFTPGTSLESIVDYLRQATATRHDA